MVKLSPKDINSYSSKNRESLMKSSKCGCYFCGAMFHPSEITTWIDNDQTAVCPHCNIDSVLAEEGGAIDITDVFLEECNEEWF
jgi:hypothetical protein